MQVNVLNQPLCYMLILYCINLPLPISLRCLLLNFIIFVPARVSIQLCLDDAYLLQIAHFKQTKY